MELITKQIRSYFGVSMSIDSIEKAEAFRRKHQYCVKDNCPTEIVVRPVGGIGCTIRVRCIGCTEEAEITDYSIW